jgi:ATP-dependent Clp protease ATP-binding subunit ClpB
MEKHAVSRIIGAPPGYVGYDEAGQLTEKVRRRPYSVILFDEIEKAHPDVLNILLQVLDDGHITDASGRVINFENTIIIMTTNAGSDKSTAISGFSTDQAAAGKERTERALLTFLRPEFINRIDEIITFRSLDENDFCAIAEIMLGDLKKALETKGITFTYTKPALEYIAKKSFSSKFGARNMRRFIESNVEDELASQIITSYNKRITSANLSISDGKLHIVCR